VASRVCLIAIALVVSGVAAASPAARTPPTGTAMFLVQHDTRLCPSPLCGGYWVALANGVRTRCADGRRQTRCYVARAFDRSGRQLSDLSEGALVRGAIERGRPFGIRTLDRVRVWAMYAASHTAPAEGGWYRVTDNGIRCVRAPCFSYDATAVNGTMRVTASSVDLESSGAPPKAIARARVALATKDGLYARGRFASTPDGGRAFRALRLYLRAPLPRA
jgi:hypothetical protein